MKLHQIYKGMLNEIGEGSSAPFSYTSDTRWDAPYPSATYSINAEAKGQPIDVLVKVVVLERDGKQLLQIDFEVEGEGWEYVVNDLRYALRLMSTIVQIGKEAMTELEELGKPLDGIMFEPSKNEDEANLDSSQTGRGRLYLAFIKKKFPGAKITQIGDEIQVVF